MADLIVRRLRATGVGFLFGMPGGGSNLDLIDAAGRAGLPFVLTATETAGALAQTEISGRPGACLTTLGRGVASVVNGVAYARLDRAPLLVFTDRHPSSAGGAFERQRLDHRALLAPVTKWSATISAENADGVMREAIDRAMAEPRGPVHIECPADVTMIETSWRGAGAASASVGPTSIDLSAAANVESLLTQASKPLLPVGLGARWRLDAGSIAALCARRGVQALDPRGPGLIEARIDPSTYGETLHTIRG